MTCLCRIRLVEIHTMKWRTLNGQIKYLGGNSLNLSLTMWSYSCEVIYDFDVQAKSF